jgi:hypothetical protein
VGFLHHWTASFAGAPITARERRHVTQPRARINVSCSRAGHKGATGGQGSTEKASEEGQRRRPAKGGCQASRGQQRVGTGPGYHTLDGTGPDRAGQGGTGTDSPEIADGIAPSKFGLWLSLDVQISPAVLNTAHVLSATVLHTPGFVLSDRLSAC